ncbi:MAG: hypothetical protein LBB48_01015 [Treponema sp.]|nr:hypothetical protein [Treponema sp.]
MARKETKTVQVGPDQADQMLNLMESFGWEFHSRQTIKNKDSHLEQRGDSVYSVTESEHYVELTFQRDTSIDHYNELVDLEQQFNAVEDPGPPPIRFGKFWLIISAVGLLLYVAPGVAIIIWRFVRYSKNSKMWASEYDAFEQERDKIVQQAKTLTA